MQFLNQMKLKYSVCEIGTKRKWDDDEKYFQLPTNIKYQPRAYSPISTTNQN